MLWARKSEEEKRRNETGYWVFSRMAILRWKIQFSNKINPWRHFKIDSGSKFFCNAIKKKNTLEISSQAKRKTRNLWSLRERERKMEIAHSMGKFNSKSFWAVNQKNGLENHINFFNLNGKCWLFSWNHEKNFVIDPNSVAAVIENHKHTFAILVCSVDKFSVFIHFIRWMLFWYEEDAIGLTIDANSKKQHAFQCFRQINFLCVEIHADPQKLRQKPPPATRYNMHQHKWEPTFSTIVVDKSGACEPERDGVVRPFN